MAASPPKSKCPNCEKMAPKGTKHCPSCGASMKM